eukprot:8664908-Lingulodinium_polyedra.AAC.1
MMKTAPSGRKRGPALHDCNDFHLSWVAHCGGKCNPATSRALALPSNARANARPKGKMLHSN